MKKWFFFLMALPFFIACNDDTETDVIPQNIDLATVENPDQKTDFDFVLDDSTRFNVLSCLIPYYRPKDGQRVIVNYTVLGSMRDGVNYTARINDVYEVLTKGIFNISPETEDSIGNDYIQIQDMWIGSHFLNVEFVYPGYNQIHFINLVADSAKKYTDGKVHLEFRHNANSDYPSFSRWGMVSFDLSSIQVNTTDRLGLVIHTKEFGSVDEKTYKLNYIYGSSALGIRKHETIKLFSAVKTFR